MNLSEEKIKSLEKIGRSLREQREKKGLSYKKVSDITRISSFNLKNLEEANYKNFPSIVFVKGFLRNYAQLLEMDSDWMMDELNKIFGAASQQNAELSNPVLLPDKENKNAKTHGRTPPLMVVGSLVVLVLISLGFVYYLYYSNTEKFSTGNINIEPISISGNKTVEKVQTPSSDKENTEKQVNAVKNEFNLSLSLLATETGWIRIDMDEGRIFDVYVESGKSYRWNASKSIDLTLSKGGMSKISFNDQLVKTPPEKINQLVNLKFAN